MANTPPPFQAYIGAPAFLLLAAWALLHGERALAVISILVGGTAAAYIARYWSGKK
jgi:hypothetical protein